MSTSRFAVIGSGSIGRGLARLASTAGLKVLLANSRGPESMVDVVSEFQGVRAASVEDAAANASIIVLAVPLAAVPELPRAALAGAVVVDATNYHPDRFGRLDAVDAFNLTSSEYVQSLLPGSRVVKALNNVDFVRLTRLPRPAGDETRSALPVAGDDAAAKLEVTALLDQLGFDALDLGGLSEGWRAEPGTPIFVSPYYRESSAETDRQARFMNAATVPVGRDAAHKLVRAAHRP